MNIFQLMNVFLAIGVLYGSFRLSSPNIWIFVDQTSIFIVIGGSLTAIGIAYQLNKIFKFALVYLRRVLMGKKVNLTSGIEELIKVIDQKKKGKEIHAIIDSVNDLFLKDALIMVRDGILSKDEIIEVMEQRSETTKKVYTQETLKMKSLAKYPPAFGMIGTTIGMIVLLSNLGGKDAMKMIGPAMSVCLITTLYGAIVANLIIHPIGDNLMENTLLDYRKKEIMIEGVKLYMEDCNPILAAEKLNSFVKVSHRVDWKKVLQG